MRRTLHLPVIIIFLLGCLQAQAQKHTISGYVSDKVTDKYFNGMSKEMIVFIRHNDLKPVINFFDNREYKAVVEINKITSDHYKYRRSYNAYRDAEENPFAEPVLLFTNVKNGYGIFSAYNLAIDTIR